MSNSIFSDSAMISAKVALNGLSKRQEAIGSNIANVDTPGYKAQTVDFESVVRAAIDDADQSPAAKVLASQVPVSSASYAFNTTQRSGGATRADGNNVDINTELVDMSETTLEYQAISQEVSSKLLLLKTIAQSG